MKQIRDPEMMGRIERVRGKNSQLKLVIFDITSMEDSEAYSAFAILLREKSHLISDITVHDGCLSPMQQTAINSFNNEHTHAIFFLSLLIAT